VRFSYGPGGGGGWDRAATHYFLESRLPLGERPPKRTGGKDRKRGIRKTGSSSGLKRKKSKPDLGAVVLELLKPTLRCRPSMGKKGFYQVNLEGNNARFGVRWTKKKN